MANLDLFGKKSVNSKINSPLDYSILAEKIKKNIQRNLRKLILQFYLLTQQKH